LWTLIAVRNSPYSQIYPQRAVPTVPFSDLLKISAARTIAAAKRYAPEAVSTANKDLRSVQAEASRLGYRGFQYDARLALGEIAMKSKNVAGARSLFESLKRDARADGFTLFEQKATAALYSERK